MFSKHKIDKGIKSNKSLSEDLFKIAQFILGKVKSYASYSSNKSIIEEILEEQPIHRLLWINTMRARNDQDGIRQLIFSWNIDISSNIPDEKFASGKVKISSKQANIVKLSQYLQKKCSTDDYHIEYNFKFKVVEVQCTVTDLNNYVYDEIRPLDSKTKRKDKSRYSNKERLEDITIRLAQWGIGNCSDLSQAGVALLMHYPSQGLKKLNLPSIETLIRVEILSIQGGDHEFIVINRKIDSALNDLKSWGDNYDDILILDPWLGECYTLNSVLSGYRKSPSVEYNFDGSKYEVEDTGFIAEGSSDHWKMKNSNLDIFNLETKVRDLEEKIPWVESGSILKLSR